MRRRPITESLARPAEDRASIDNGTPRPRHDDRPLVLFHRDIMDERERAEAERGPRGGPGPHRPVGCGDRVADTGYGPDREAGRCGRRGRPRGPCWASSGVSKRADRHSAALAREPNRESALVGAADAAARAGRLDDAIADLRRAIAVNPWRPAYRSDLAALCFDRRDWPAATAACRDALRLNPADLETRKLLVRCHLRLEDIESARAEFRNPPRLRSTRPRGPDPPVPYPIAPSVGPAAPAQNRPDSSRKAGIAGLPSHSRPAQPALLGTIPRGSQFDFGRF